jgi:rare lipoprotein A
MEIVGKEIIKKCQWITFTIAVAAIFILPRSVSSFQHIQETRIGYAVFYSQKYSGNKTTSGRFFSNVQYVAAHPKYPLGTVVKVTNLKNQRSVLVRIIDRGISKENQNEGIIIDVSQEAAKALGFINQGKAKVKVEVVEWGNKS